MSLRRQRSPEVVPRPLAAAPAAITDAYLVEYFYNFVRREHCHVGFYFPNSRKVKIELRRWIGLRDKPVFFVIQAIHYIPAQGTVPKHGTAERWNDYVAHLPGAHPDFQQVFIALQQRGFITQTNGDFDDEIYNSTQEAVRKYCENEELVMKFFPRRSFLEICNIIGRELKDFCTPEHMFNSWIFTDIFWALREKTAK